MCFSIKISFQSRQSLIGVEQQLIVEGGFGVDGIGSVLIEVEHTLPISLGGAGSSSSQIQRYIRLNELEPELLQLVDEGKIGMTPAVEISYLKPDEQRLLIETIDSEQATPSFSQAQRMRRLSGEGKLNDDTILGIMLEQKKPENWNLTLPMEKIRKYFPRSYTPQRMEETILKLLESWMRQQKRQRDQQR